MYYSLLFFLKTKTSFFLPAIKFELTFSCDNILSYSPQVYNECQGENKVQVLQKVISSNSV